MGRLESLRAPLARASLSPSYVLRSPGYETINRTRTSCLSDLQMLTSRMSLIGSLNKPSNEKEMTSPRNGSSVNSALSKSVSRRKLARHAAPSGAALMMATRRKFAKILKTKKQNGCWMMQTNLPRRAMLCRALAKRH
ncbi:DEAD_2 domain-containing protein [Verticillium alfalfae VaMs.102]|uniref:DEAD_2 domain-containing protein n=1 Tax=Verticillium alfalfae (strain VaMs.102 / ATCC MYA-4576 / FGSC 10136) TaxID=526221 RepID=C9SY40_VERA1|nr:DEAD_2 domain-containing protein [Verticillium alfalfae VaMs.102]EEY23705.1 DEAD_2 domain-containing protein [Verticillium alfalfae VaMs.102]